MTRLDPSDIQRLTISSIGAIILSVAAIVAAVGAPVIARAEPPAISGQAHAPAPAFELK